MDLTSLTILAVVLGNVVLAFGLWLSIKIFKLQSDRISVAKIIGYETGLSVLSSLANFAFGKNVQAIVSLAFFVGGIGLWIILLKRYALTNYTTGRAIGSLITGYIFGLVFSVALALAGLAFFAQVYAVDGNTMSPGLKANQTVLVYKFAKHPNNNEIVVFRNAKGKQALGRVHGTPGQSVAVPGGRVEVEGTLKNASTYTLGGNQYYVTVDNTSTGIPPRIITSNSLIGTVGPKL